MGGLFLFYAALFLVAVQGAVVLHNTVHLITVVVSPFRDNPILYLYAVKAQAADPVLLKAIYKEMEFNSLLKELGPSEDTRERQYAVVASASELLAWLTEAQGAPVAVAISK